MRNSFSETSQADVEEATEAVKSVFCPVAAEQQIKKMRMGKRCFIVKNRYSIFSNRLHRKFSNLLNDIAFAAVLDFRVSAGLCVTRYLSNCRKKRSFVHKRIVSFERRADHETFNTKSRERSHNGSEGNRFIAEIV
jgi:hypothetical protein